VNCLRRIALNRDLHRKHRSLTHFRGLFAKAVTGVALVVFCASLAMHRTGGAPRPRHEQSGTQPRSLTAPNTAGLSDLYVAPQGSDDNPGTIQKPLATIQRAADLANPGTTVHVSPGTYVQAVNITRSGLPNARIRFISDSRWTAKVTGNGTINDAFMVREADYVDIVGFEVINETGYQGIELYGSHDRALGNHVHNVWADGCKDWRGGAGINSSNPSAPGNEISGNVVHDIGDYAHGCASVHGIYIANAQNTVQNNIAYRNQGWGITSWHKATDNIITNNTVFNNDVGGINTGASDSATDDHTLVANNIVVFNGVNSSNLRYGIGQEGSNGPHNRYLNNVVYGNRPADLKVGVGTLSGTITANPATIFINYTGDGSGDYRFRPGSLATGSTPVGATIEEIRTAENTVGAVADPRFR
jgi:parallel beta-helix repeat protein